MWGIVLWPCFYDIIWHCSSDDGTMSARSQFFRNLCRPAYRSTSERVPRCGNFAKQFRSYAFELLLYNWALGLVVSIQQNLLRLVRQIPLNRRSIQSWFSLVACGGRSALTSENHILAILHPNRWHRLVISTGNPILTIEFGDRAFLFGELNSVSFIW